LIWLDLNRFDLVWFAILIRVHNLLPELAAVGLADQQVIDAGGPTLQ
jgi:hypothetical protein